jgi:DNA repair protein RecN (Recombination protein N)
MLERLHIRDLALIERADLELSAGLNVLTGETGAGKSLIVQALDLIIGERADAGVVREGAEAAKVEAEFRIQGPAAKTVARLLEEWGVEFDGETVIIRREIASGRSRATVNQSPVTLGALKQLGERLADLHGQHEHQSLLRAEAGIETLDRLAGLEDQRAAYAVALAKMRAAAEELSRIEQALAVVQERREQLEDAAREIDELKPEAGEDAKLKEEVQRFAHRERLGEHVQKALEAVYEAEPNAASLLAGASHAVEQGATLDPALSDILKTLEEARIACTEAARALANYAADLGADPSAIEALETRRDLLQKLMRRHRRSLEELVEWREVIRKELALAEDGAAMLAVARADLDQAEAATLAAARALSRQREIRGREWSEKLSRELTPLGFPHAKIAFEVRRSDTKPPAYTATGIDEVEIAFTANPGEPARPLRRVGSGGEISRIMLALKCALQSLDPVDVLIFDEIDTGIGGAVARAVGERLRALAAHRQILCVTHLPMIAALATKHLFVRKQVTRGRTVATIETLSEKDRIEELSRMLAGDRATETTRRQARELLHSGEGR